jgi:hypothetical protein
LDPWLLGLRELYSVYFLKAITSANITGWFNQNTTMGSIVFNTAFDSFFSPLHDLQVVFQGKHIQILFIEKRFLMKP